jgi:hypothetical protein
MCAAHFDLGEQSALGPVPPMMVVPLTLPLIATPPQFASTLGFGSVDL